MSSRAAVNPTPSSVGPKLLAFFLAALFVFAPVAWLLDGNRWKKGIERLAWFQIQDVKIQSEWPLTTGDIRAMLPPLKGANLLLVEPTALITRLRQQGWVENVTIQKEFPNRLRIEVQTKHAEAIAVIRGQAYFIDGKGWLLGKASPSLLKSLDLPVLSWEREAARSGWDLPAMVKAASRFRASFQGKPEVSQLVLEDFPYFKVFLTHPKVEVLFDFTRWEEQLPRLAILLHESGSDLGLPQKIDLSLSNKAVVALSPTKPSSLVSPKHSAK